MKEPPSEIHPLENIGRELFSSGHYSRKSRKVNYKAFFWRGHSSLSVDRLDYGRPRYLRDVGLRNAEERELNFHGWAKLSAEKAELGGRKLEADPIPGENECHANLHLPAKVTNDTQRREEAIELARLSKRVAPDWRPHLGLREV